MRRRSLMCCAALLMVASCWAQARSKAEYKNRDGARVVVVPVGKPPGHENYESRIEFYSPENRLLCSLDYSSEDGEHGFGVVKAAWTQDGRYLVFSLSSSGGHQSWHYPTHFYNAQDSRIYSLGDYVEASGISKGDFTLRAPNAVLTESWKGEAVPVRFRLDKLMAKSHIMMRAVLCADAKVVKPQN